MLVVNFKAIIILNIFFLVFLKNNYFKNLLFEGLGKNKVATVVSLKRLRRRQVHFRI